MERPKAVVGYEAHDQKNDKDTYDQSHDSSAGKRIHDDKQGAFPSTRFDVLTTMKASPCRVTLTYMPISLWWSLSLPASTSLHAYNWIVIDLQFEMTKMINRRKWYVDLNTYHYLEIVYILNKYCYLLVNY